MPTWKIPANLDAVIESSEDAIWETDDWEPIRLVVMGTQLHEGRPVQLMWQMEYDTVGCSGYTFCEQVLQAARKVDSGLLPMLNCNDTESSTFVIWVETEVACRRLVEIVWPMVSGS